MSGLLVAVIARVPEARADEFAAYETRVLPMLADHGARLERRVRDAGGALEIHLVRFPGTEAYEAFRADPRRAVAAELLQASGAEVSAVVVDDVEEELRPRPAFVFGAMSPYSWFTAERVEAVLGPVRWWPVFAGGLFKSRGRPSWGLTDERPAHVAECEARAQQHGLGPITWPDRWPTVDLKIARALARADDAGATRELALAAMRLTFREGRDLDDPATIEEAARRAGLDPSWILAGVDDPTVKERTRALTDAAFALGIRGIPTLVVQGELFWGDDRLEEAAAAQLSSGGSAFGPSG